MNFEKLMRKLKEYVLGKNAYSDDKAKGNEHSPAGISWLLEVKS